MLIWGSGIPPPFGDKTQRFHDKGRNSTRRQRNSFVHGPKSSHLENSESITMRKFNWGSQDSQSVSEDLNDYDSETASVAGSRKRRARLRSAMSTNKARTHTPIRVVMPKKTRRGLTSHQENKQTLVISPAEAANTVRVINQTEPAEDLSTVTDSSSKNQHSLQQLPKVAEDLDQSVEEEDSSLELEEEDEDEEDELRDDDGSAELNELTGRSGSSLDGSNCSVLDICFFTEAVTECAIEFVCGPEELEDAYPPKPQRHKVKINKTLAASPAA